MDLSGGAYHCPQCNSRAISAKRRRKKTTFQCQSCGVVWQAKNHQIPAVVEDRPPRARRLRICHLETRHETLDRLVKPL